MQRAEPTALKSGLVIGAAGALFALIFDALVAIGGQTPSGGAACGGCVAFLASLALCAEAGHVAAAASGRVSDGIVAGLIAGGLAGVGLGLLSPLYEIVTGHMAHTPVLSAVITSVIVIAVAACAIAGLGAALGALGGLVGQSRYAKSQRPPSTGAVARSSAREPSEEHRGQDQ
ncbi:MAG TPA: hypothetical protein VJQ45_12905 [Ktedonobacterales bacterium]|nr:hypothetical protein [Ktedonobacterales bacterium]